MHFSKLDKAADYRRRAQEARTMAAWITLNDAKQQLLDQAKHLEALAEIEERKAQQTIPIQAPNPKRD